MSDVYDYIAGLEGFNPRAYWDNKQWSIGYGTKANSPNEVIDQAEGRRRLQSEVDKAGGYVNSAFPNLEPHRRDALTSFTYNLGPGWMNDPSSRMGAAVRAGDWDSAARVMNEYTKASGQFSPGLANRRQSESAMLLGSPLQSSGSSAPMPLTYSPQSGGTFESYQGDTPEEVQRKAALAQALMGQASSTEPVRHWTQALARVFAGANAGLLNSQAEEARKAGGASVLRALTSPGETQDKIAALAATPWGQDMAKQLALHSIEAGMPKFGKIGTDPFLGDQMGWINQGKQTITPAVPQQPQTPEGGAAPGAINSSSLAPLANLTGQEFLDKLGPVLGPNGPAVTNKIKNIAEGREKPLTELRNATNQQIMRWVAQYDPTYDAVSRVKARTEFAGGGLQSPAAQITAGNTAIKHAGELSDIVKRMDNFDTGIPGNMTANQLRNWYKEKAGTATDLKEFRDTRERYISEITKFYRGSPGSEADMGRAIDALNEAGSPSELQAVIRRESHLMADKVAALQERWRTALGSGVKDFPVLHQDSKGAIANIEKNYATLKRPNAAAAAVPPGSPSAAPGAVSAPPPPEFIKAAQSAGIPPDKAATIPENGFIANPKTGQKFWRINNKLVDEKQLQAQEPPPAPPQVPNPLSNFDTSGQFTGPR